MKELLLFLTILCKVEDASEEQIRKCIDFNVTCIKFEGSKVVRESIEECEKRYKQGERFNEKDSTN